MIQPAAAIRGRHWADVNEVTFLTGMRLMFCIYRIFGRWPVRAALYPIVFCYMVAQPAARAASRDYLKRLTAIAGSSRVAPGMIGVLRHFVSFAETMLDKMLLWSGWFETDRIALHGQEKIGAQIASKRGAILICSHLGNLDLSRVVSKQRAGFKLTMLVHTKHAERFNRLLAQLDPASQLDLMQVTEMSAATATLLAEKIDRGEFVAIVGDRIPIAPRPRVAWARFLGDRAPFPVGPYVLAGLLQCPVYLLFSMRAGRAAEIHFELFRESIRLPRKGRDEALAGLAADYAARLERFCLKTPLQWFNFYDFWRMPHNGD
jgi:predicted LPLAT superfamily acyltransferase